MRFRAIVVFVVLRSPLCRGKKQKNAITQPFLKLGGPNSQEHTLGPFAIHGGRHLGLKTLGHCTNERDR